MNHYDTINYDCLCIEIVVPNFPIKEEVDILEFPRDISKLKNKAITIRDLNGNSIKLMFMLIKHGIVEGINKDDYNSLVDIYKTKHVDDLLKDHFKKFNNILSKMRFRQDYFVRLIGGELADKGMNDYFTLKILEALNTHSVPVEILFSNHSAEFIRAYEHCENNGEYFYNSVTHAEEGDQYTSISNLRWLNRLNLIGTDNILNIANTSYKSKLKVVSYSLDKSGMSIYSYAPIDLDKIKNLANNLGVEYIDTTAIDLARTIDEINYNFQQYVQSNLVTNRLYKYPFGSILDMKNISSADNPFEFFAWNRETDSLDRANKIDSENLYFINNVDNTLGKEDEFDQDDRNVFISPLNHDMDKTRTFFFEALYKIKYKANELKKDKHNDAAEAAEKLHMELISHHRRLYSNRITPDDFKNKCIDSINMARTELEKHRGWKKVIMNLVLGIFLLLPQLLNKSITGNFLFFNKTDSANKLDQIEESFLLKKK